MNFFNNIKKFFKKKDDMEQQDYDFESSGNNQVVIKKEDGFFKSVVSAFLLAVLIRTFLYEPFHIPSGSMKPGLLEGDFILVSKFSYGYGRYTIPFGIPIIRERIFDWKKPKRGDVIVFRLPANPKINYIKRLIGLPGDKITVKDGMVYINDVELEREYVDDYYDKKNSEEYLEYKEKLTDDKSVKILQLKFKENFEFYDTEDGDGEFYVPDGYYFFMGDNRDNSLDSRFVETGYIPYRNLVGKAKIVFFSESESLFKFWKWHKTIRFKRIFKIIK